MRRIFGLAFALIAITTISTGWASQVMAEGEGYISGQITNKTAGGSSVEALEVTLVTFLNGEATDARQRAVTDASGRFAFIGLSTDNTTAYAVNAFFQEAHYNTGPIGLTPDGPVHEVELVVYDSTTSDVNLRISKGHIVVYMAQGALEVLEVWRFNNTGDKTYIGAGGKAGAATLKFTLPAGAASLASAQGFPIEAAEGGAISTAALPPGFTDVNMTYFIPFQDNDATLSRRIDYPVVDFSLLTEDTGTRVASSTLAPAAPQMINGANFLKFTAGNLAAGAVLDASFYGIVNPSASSPEELFPWRWLIIGAVLLVTLIGFTYPQLKKQQASAGLTPAPPANEDALLLELARLDDEFESGVIEEKEYKKRRAQLKADLTEIYGQTDGRETK